MKILKKISALIAGVTLLFSLSNCSKERLGEEPQLNKYDYPESFFNTYKPAEQTFVVTKDGNGPIIGLGGTKIWVDSTLFMYPNGTDITYPFTIKLVELYKPKDMLLYNMPTVSGGQLLVTGGEVRIRAFKDNQELVLKPSKVYLINMPGPVDKAMQIFYGSNTGSMVDWSMGGGTMNTDSAFYKMILPKVGWINCDRFYSYPGSKAKVKFSSEKDELTNVAKFLYFDKVKSLMQVYGNESGEVPVGDHAKIVCIGSRDGKMYYYKTDLTVGSSDDIKVTMEEIENAALISYLAGL